MGATASTTQEKRGTASLGNADPKESQMQPHMVKFHLQNGQQWVCVSGSVRKTLIFFFKPIKIIF